SNTHTSRVQIYMPHHAGLPIWLGGVINKKQRFIYSETALETLRQIHFNTAFIGGSRIRDDGVYTPSMADSKIVETAASRANQVVLVAEKYKFTNQSSSPYMSVPSIRSMSLLPTPHCLRN